MDLVGLGEIPRDGRGGAMLGHARSSGDVGPMKSMSGRLIAVPARARGVSAVGDDLPAHPAGEDGAAANSTYGGDRCSA